ncbi:MAG: pseudouridine synthase [Bacteroides sp.]|nr:pseudouridine synthase [Bacteroides sp.]
MSTEQEEWNANSYNPEERSNEGRDGNSYYNNRETNYNREDNYNRTSYNRYDRGQQRQQRPRFNPNGADGNRQTRPYNSYNRPSYNREGGDGERSFRPRFNPNREVVGGERPYRPRFNPNSYDNAEGERPSRPAYNREGGERPYRPRFNPNSYEGGNSDRPYRPAYNREGQNGERPYRPRFNPNSYEGGNSERPYRPAFNRDGAEGYRPYRPAYSREGGNGEGGDRPFRPRFNNGNRQQGGFRPRTADYNPNAKYSKKKQIEYKQAYVDPNEPIRLNKFLANAGVCSRREADEFITAGVVSVNGQVVTELGTKIKHGDEVKFHEQPVSIERKIYVLLNKPKDTVTTSDDPQERRTVMDLVKGACPERIYPVGRLDRNTTGVLLLTNDGDLASKLTHPKFLKKKIYHVFLDKNLTKADMEQIAAGIQLEDGEIHADEISYIDEAKRNEVGIEIHSGKNRIVRRIFESLGYRVLKLDRVFFAGLTKKGLKRGDWRFLTEREVNFLRMGSFE